MSLTPGTSVSLKGRTLKATDSREVQYLHAILAAINNLAGVTGSSALTSPTTSVGTVVGQSGTLTLAANTYKSVSFQVITGTMTVSYDGGAGVAYPVGSNITITGNPIRSSIAFTNSAGASDKTAVTTLS